MSTRLSTEELDAIAFTHTNQCDACEHCQHRFPYDDCVTCGESWPCSSLDLVAEIRASWDDAAAARRALRDLAAALEYSPVWDDWKDAPEVVEARAVLSENPTP